MHCSFQIPYDRMVQSLVGLDLGWICPWLDWSLLGLFLGWVNLRLDQSLVGLVLGWIGPCLDWSLGWISPRLDQLDCFLVLAQSETKKLFWYTLICTFFEPSGHVSKSLIALNLS